MTVNHERIWAVLDEQVAAGRIPGYVAAVRIDGEAEVHASGRTAFGSGAAPMAHDTLFRIASVSKPIGAALTLSLIEQGTFGLDDEIGRWLPEFAGPRVLRHPDGPLDDTVAVETPITVRHLLTSTAGFGAVIESSPLQACVDRCRRLSRSAAASDDRRRVPASARGTATGLPAGTRRALRHPDEGAQCAAGPGGRHFTE